MAAAQWGAPTAKLFKQAWRVRDSAAAAVAQPRLFNE